ncbi:putative uncharacterized protein [Parachlamydia acanthamoebae UV-7]|uniref:Uncharacterized protein n=1 Tax=Parachlamydia acanthamoebae (strain UV7) TaxID=765952 RepID=F8L1K5_PARAV|nr:putative uncharacterized protein [Parachlamydia acanthamoebae UV-7]
MLFLLIFVIFSQGCEKMHMFDRHSCALF